MLTARDLVGKPIGTLVNFITEDEQKRLLDYVRADDAPWENVLPPDHLWHARIIDPRAMAPDILRTMIMIRRRAANLIMRYYEIPGPVFGDTLQLVRWRTGDFQKPHADCELPDGSPSEFPWRAFVSIVYLNDDYDGGEIYFPTQDIYPKLGPRTVAFFPCTAEYLHGVKRVEQGTRYTISSFFTFDPARSDGETF